MESVNKSFDELVKSANVASNPELHKFFVEQSKSVAKLVEENKTDDISKVIQ
jgi:hypothetical protein